MQLHVNGNLLTCLGKSLQFESANEFHLRARKRKKVKEKTFASGMQFNPYATSKLVYTFVLKYHFTKLASLLAARGSFLQLLPFPSVLLCLHSERRWKVLLNFKIFIYRRYGPATGDGARRFEIVDILFFYRFLFRLNMRYKYSHVEVEQQMFTGDVSRWWIQGRRKKFVH